MTLSGKYFSSLLGSNLTGLKSRVRLTERVELNDDHSLSEVRARYGADLHAFLDEPGISESAWICGLYPGLEHLDEAQARAQYHITEVDINSLARFIIWLTDQSCHFPKTAQTHHVPPSGVDLSGGAV